MRRQRKIAGMNSAVTLPGCAGAKEEKYKRRTEYESKENRCSHAGTRHGSVTDEATEVLDLTDVTVAERTDDNVICYNYGVDAGLTFTVTAADTDTLVFINGEARTSFTATSDAPIQVLVQKGTAEPFVVVIQ